MFYINIIALALYIKSHLKYFKYSFKTFSRRNFIRLLKIYFEMNISLIKRIFLTFIFGVFSAAPHKYIFFISRKIPLFINICDVDSKP